MQSRWIVLSGIALLTATTIGECQVIASGALPQHHAGLAARYPGDRGIESDPKVVFVEHFVGTMSEVQNRWESAKGDEFLSLVDDTPAGSADRQALLVSHVGGKGTDAYLYRTLPPGFTKLHYRFYVKFDEACAPIHHFFHVGGYHPMTAWPQGGAGTRPAGDARFTTGIEPFGSAWQWDFYSYWMNMRGSPPRGQCWGNSFIHDPSLKVTRGRWQCVELMMKLNEVGSSTGELALWLDGKLVSHLGPGFPRGKWVYDKFLPGQGGEGVRWDERQQRAQPLNFGAEGEPFEGFEWRSNQELQLNFLWLLCYITEAKPGQVSKVWFDQIVVARDYIGPLSP